MKKFIIFDFFGVIGAETLFLWLDRHGISRLDSVARTITHEADLGKITEDEEFSRLGEITGQSKSEIKSEWSEISGLNLPLLEEIRKLKEENFHISILSNASATYINRVFSESKIPLSLFDKIIISSNIGLAKPDPKIFEYALRELGATPDECIFVDDREKNVLAAKSLGIDSIQYISLENFKNSLKSLQNPQK